MGYGIDARKEKFEVVTVLGQKMLFTCCRVDRNSVPKGLFLYEVRHADDNFGQPIEIGNWIMVNHWGTLLSCKPIALEKSPVTDNSYRDIDEEKDWNYEGYEITTTEYLDTYAPKKEKQKSYER